MSSLTFAHLALGLDVSLRSCHPCASIDLSLYTFRTPTAPRGIRVRWRTRGDVVVVVFARPRSSPHPPSGDRLGSPSCIDTARPPSRPWHT